MGEIVYIFLMALGWFFLLGWSIALLTACAVAFRKDVSVDTYPSLPPNANSVVVHR
jgi:hypothetical protein